MSARAAWGVAQVGAGLLTFWCCRHRFGRRGTTPVVQIVAAAGLVATLAALAQQLVDPTRLYGLWTPLDAGARPFRTVREPQSFRHVGRDGDSARAWLVAGPGRA